ncbi:MAG TPA: N-acetyltransferase family protein [Trichocoleus sp.]
MGESVIRPATLADITAITAIYGYHVQHGLASFEWEPPDESEMAHRMKQLLFTGKGYPYFVAEQGGNVVGYAYAGPYRTRAGYCYAVEDSVYIKPGFQGQGLGKGLLSVLLEASAQRGYRQMIAVIGDSRNQPSIALHQALGFYHAGVLKDVGFKAGQWLDSVLMQRPLGQGATILPKVTKP